MKKIGLVLMSLLTTMVVLLHAAPTVKAEESTETVEFILHKLQGTNNVSVQNTGEKMDPEDFYGEGGTFKGLANVQFTAFDISDYFYLLREDEDAYRTAEALISHLNNLNLMVNGNGELVTKDNVVITAKQVGEKTTDANGQVNFNLSANHADNKGKVYVFVETKAPAEVVSKSAALIVGLPLFDSNDEEMTTVHLYPKNFLDYGSLKGEKVVQTIIDNQIELIKLPNAEFYIHQPDTKFVAGESLVLSKLINGVRTWVEQSDENAEVFKTDDDGILLIEYLAQGNYMLTEISTQFGENFIAKNNTVENAPVSITVGEQTTFENKLINDDLNVNKSNEGGSYQYGDLIDYTVVAAIPTGIADEGRYSKFEIVDTHHEHLSLVNDTLTLKIGDTILNKDDYAFEKTSDHTFKINFDDTLDVLKGGAGEMLTITYQMMVTTDAVPDVAMNNEVTIDTDLDKETDKGTDVYTGGHKFVKIDGHSGAFLEGAIFYITNEEGAKLVKTEEGYGWSNDEEPNNLVYLTSQELGVFEITGLRYGHYELHEVKTPGDNYILPNDGFRFEIAQNSYQNNKGLLEIENYTQGFLPATGGMGIIIFLVLGTLTMGGTVYWLKKA